MISNAMGNMQTRNPPLSKVSLHTQRGTEEDVTLRSVVQPLNDK